MGDLKAGTLAGEGCFISLAITVLTKLNLDGTDKMEFSLNTEQKMLKQNAATFLKKEVAPKVEEYERMYPFPKELAHELLKKLIPLGYIDGPIPKDSGGQGLDFLSWGILIEELAKVWASLAMMVGNQVITAYDLAADGTEEQKKQFLFPVMAADKITCFAGTEPDAGSDERSISTSAVLDNDDYIINGTKVWVSNGNIADLVCVTAVTNKSEDKKEISLILIDKERSPFKVSPLPKLGLHAYTSAELRFEDCRVPKRNLFGKSGISPQKAISWDIWRCTNAAISVGMAQAACEASIEYARERHQFGRPIGSFQLIQESIVDMVTLVQAARLLTYHTWFLLDNGEKCRGQAAMAKAFANEVAMDVTSKAIDIHGSYGISEEFPLERYYRDARTIVFPDGTLEIMKLIAGREILGLSAII